MFRLKGIIQKKKKAIDEGKEKIVENKSLI